MNDDRDALLNRIYDLDAAHFENLALDIFHYQSNQNTFYRSYLDNLGFDCKRVKSINDIPFLPIQFFKGNPIKTGAWKEQKIFQSSGTTNQLRSHHYLREEYLYKSLSVRCFEDVYGKVEDYCFLALLPHYLEQGQSSLVYMFQHFIELSKYSESSFYLRNQADLIQRIEKVKSQNIPTILIGVSYALLDLADSIKIDLDSIIIMETGGMKGRREEWSKKRLHNYLKEAFQVSQIHSEYGMTEMFSQAYAQEDGLFQESPSMKVIIKDVTDPFETRELGKSGIVNIVDLANLDTCSFIETEDLGIKISANHFRLIGRLDDSDIRGCNLLIP